MYEFPSYIRPEFYTPPPKSPLVRPYRTIGPVRYGDKVGGPFSRSLREKRGEGGTSVSFGFRDLPQTVSCAHYLSSFNSQKLLLDV